MQEISGDFSLRRVEELRALYLATTYTRDSYRLNDPGQAAGPCLTHNFVLRMPYTEQSVDLYIARAREFARPILEHLRVVVHQACPNVEETIKWGCPHFVYSGKILCSMAAFKGHCAFVFRLGSLMEDPSGVMKTKGHEKAMGHFGQIKKPEDLPSDHADLPPADVRLVGTGHDQSLQRRL